MSAPTPSVGRIVHYKSYGTPNGEYKPECRAAVITAVHDDQPVPEHGVPYVDLFVMNPTGVFLNTDAKYDAGNPDGSGQPGGTWHWPERVEA